MCPCRECHLDADSLQSVAQLRNVKELYLFDFDGLTSSCMESFLRAAVQGSRLHIMTSGSITAEERQQRRAMYENLIESLGAQNVPRWRP
jgi:hypothetical protein